MDRGDADNVVGVEVTDDGSDVELDVEYCDGVGGSEISNDALGAEEESELEDLLRYLNLSLFLFLKFLPTLEQRLRFLLRCDDG